MKLSAEVRVTHSEDGAIVLDVLHGQMFRANFVGSHILQLLRDGRSENYIVEDLMGKFGVTPETIAADVRDFLAHLEKNRLLDFRYSEAPPFL